MSILEKCPYNIPSLPIYLKWYHCLLQEHLPELFYLFWTNGNWWPCIIDASKGSLMTDKIPSCTWIWLPIYPGPCEWSLTIELHCALFYSVQRQMILLVNKRELKLNPLSRNEPQCALLLLFTCLTPDDFTHQWGSSAA